MQESKEQGVRSEELADSVIPAKAGIHRTNVIPSPSLSSRSLLLSYWAPNVLALKLLTPNSLLLTLPGGPHL